jgi:hypothetical protein
MLSLMRELVLQALNSNAFAITFRSDSKAQVLHLIVAKNQTSADSFWRLVSLLETFRPFGWRFLFSRHDIKARKYLRPPDVRTCESP